MIELLARATLAGAAVANLRSIVGEDPWVPDSYDYAIRTLMWRGRTFAEATAEARAFFARTEVGNEARYAHVFAGAEPEWWRLFAPRVLYPAAAALLARYRGMHALADLPRAGYLGYHVALYAFLRRSGSPLAALAVTLAVMRGALVRDLASRAMTDVPAMVPWTIALDAAVQIARDGRGWLRFAAATAVLSFTRPLPYLPFGAGAGLFAAGCLARDATRIRRGAGMAGIGGAAALAVMVVLARAGMPSTRAHLERVRAAGRTERDLRAAAPSALDRLTDRLGARDEPGYRFERWYATNVALSVATTLLYAARDGLPAIAAAGLVAQRARPEVAVYAGAIAGNAAGIVGDPVPGGTSRTILMPLGPVVAAGAVLALDALARRVRRR